MFGVNCEALPRQVNFLTDEAGECGKGANDVVSRLHYYLETHGLGEKVAFLHADNCTGQNVTGFDKTLRMGFFQKIAIATQIANMTFELIV